MKEKKRLWTKDFTCITTATILSAIGGEAIMLPVSLLVFDETQSTILAALIMVCGMLPDVVLPIFVAPLIDKSDKKSWVVGLDILMAIVFLLTGLWIGNHTFNYGLYVTFTLVIGSISVFYRLAYTSWYPDLITIGMEQKGYAVSSTIYPVVTIIMSPVATFLYERISMSTLFIAVAALTLVSIIIESCISRKAIRTSEQYSVKQYFTDIKEGFSYIKREKGIRNIYLYMGITQGTSEGSGIIIQAFYQTQPYLTVTMLGFLRSVEMIGRLLSGIFQYMVKIPAKKRYALTKFVYTFYEVMDISLLFSPYPLMLGNRFLCGALGTTSATIRETAVQSYLPKDMRARVNAMFSVIFAIGGVGFQVIGGILGQIMPLPYACALLGAITLVAVVIFIYIPSKENRKVYEAERTEEVTE